MFQGHVKVLLPVEEMVAKKQMGLWYIGAVLMILDDSPVLVHHVVDLSKFAIFMGQKESHLIAIFKVWKIA
jgi:hypothetical protein